jgi:hypothetical protein
MPEQRYAGLGADLVALGRDASTPAASPALVAGVMTRVEELPAPSAVDQLVGGLARGLGRVRAVLSERRRAVVAAVVAVLLALLVAPPVRAAVSELLDFAGVVVRTGSDERSEPAPPPPSAESGLTVEGAARLVDFSPFVPQALGPPDGVEVSADRLVLSMTWATRAGTVRLDEFDGRFDDVVAKTAPDVEFTEVGGDFAMWFERPHRVVFFGPDGTRRTETARLAGHTLIWERAGVTLRLEGDVVLDRAREIADSALPAR